MLNTHKSSFIRKSGNQIIRYEFIIELIYGDYMKDVEKQKKKQNKKKKMRRRICNTNEQHNKQHAYKKGII